MTSCGSGSGGGRRRVSVSEMGRTSVVSRWFGSRGSTSRSGSGRRGMSLSIAGERSFWDVGFLGFWFHFLGSVFFN